MSADRLSRPSWSEHLAEAGYLPVRTVADKANSELAMVLDSNTKILRRVPLFSDLTNEQLSIIAFTGSWRSFRPGETIIERGRTATAAFVILTGQAMVIRMGENTEPERLGPGALLGEPAMFFDTTYRSTVVAERGVGTIAITRETIQKIVQRDPSIAKHLAESIRGRIGAMSASLERLGQHLSQDRLA